MADSLRALSDADPDAIESPVLIVDRGGTLLRANESCWALLDAWEIAEGDSVPPNISALGRDARLARRVRHVSLDVGPISLQLIAIPSPEDDLVTFLGADITRERNLNRDRAVQTLVYQTGHEAIVVSDQWRRTIDVNPAFLRMSGYTEEEVLGERPEYLLKDSSALDQLQEIGNQLRESGLWHGRIWHHHRDGHRLALELTISRIQVDPDQTLFYVSILHDVTGQVEANEKLSQLANFDTLTQLPNRRFFTESVKKAISTTRRTPERFAVMLVDLDGFKQVNDTFGHSAGDELLRVTARRMAGIVRDTDTVARLGGDEFGLLIRDIHAPGDAAVVARKLLEAITEPVVSDSNELVVSGSVGIALFPTDHTEFEHLLRQADNAMYRVKHHGKGDYTFFSQTAHTAAMRGFRIQTRLSAAVADGIIDVHYQPQYDLRSRTLVGFEALARWTDSSLGSVSPEDFVSIAENVGLIHKLGEHVLRKACAQAQEWVAHAGSDFRVAVNVSGRQFNSKGFPAMVRSVLRDTGLDPSRLELELTETVFVDDTSRIGPVMNEIAALGVRFSVDDFGTRYASLMYLKLLPFHALKIDRAFVKDLYWDTQDRSIVETICALGSSLGCRVIAEGVESLEQMKILGSLGCDEVQGYYAGRPEAASRVEPYIVERKWDGSDRSKGRDE